MTTTPENRRHGRHPIEGIVGTLRTPGDIEVRDVGLYGMSLRVEGEVEVRSRHFLELHHCGHKVNVEVEVRWVVLHRKAERGQVETHCHAGVEFIDIHRDDMGGIWDWILVARATNRPTSG
jgi:hypothetical protein